MGSQLARKRFGQHWLTSQTVLQSIVAAAAVTAEDGVLEIGPGTGVLTTALVERAGGVVAVEIDRDRSRQLRRQFAHQPNFTLVEGDILSLDLSDLISPLEDQPLNKVVANIPYYITGPILEKLLGTLAQPNPQPYQGIVLMVQREVADRLCARPGSRAFGALSVRVQYLATCELVCPVPASAFTPAPKVDSAVVRLTPRPLAVPAQSPQRLEQLVKLGFASKRKMLRNNLKSLMGVENLTALLGQLGVSPTVRAEDLSLEQWVALSNSWGETLNAW
ncbi:MAG: 16S rRNA (adenine(1518)-N(6)/adenine(1519)-N(6))-dimethyltransferase RsmA [Cyanobacteria bacterium REEB459]|nr:16S rRNA (adenine(1518)-N(6)/adenine(1519)-N(6))-dimethyltransferase RsmA [Cyanobacteria bacterium REEB459]